MSASHLRGVAAGCIAVLAALLVYGEHLFAAAVDRSWAHYVADGAHGVGFWVLLGIGVLALVPRGVARSVMLCSCAWAGCECVLTVAGGLVWFGGGIADPEQWQGLFGRGLGLPLAACGLTGFAVFIFSMWGTDEA